MNPYVIIGLIIAWGASLFGVGHWQNAEGHTEERVAWQAKDNQELAQANAKILTLEAAARDTEHRHAAEIDSVATTYEKEKANALAKKDSVIADLRSGALRLRDPYSLAFKASGGPTGAAPASSGQRDGGAGGELSVSTSEFLIGLASDADEVVKQLQACQAVVRSDRDLKGPAP